MVDYSKWDKFAEDLSDEEDNKGFQVQQFEQGSRVTIGPKGANIEAAAAVADLPTATTASTHVRILFSQMHLNVLDVSFLY
jgi:hypothetical protein